MLKSLSFSSESSNWKRWFFGSLSFSLILHLFCSYFSVGYHAADEHFQILEFLNYKLGLTPQSVLPDEFHEQMRPWLQPAFYYGVVKVLKGFGVQSPFNWVWVFRMICSLVGWSSLVLMALCSRYWFQGERAQRFFLAANGLLWFLPALHSRASSEGLGGSLFLIGLCLLSIHLEFSKSQGNSSRSFSVLTLIGALFGLSFECRFQMALMLVGTLGWVLVYKRLRWGQILSVFAGFFVIFALGRWVDVWGYGSWSWSPWNYFSYNLIRGGASQYGDSPWWDIFRMSLTESWPPLGFFLLIAMIVAWLRHPKHLLTWAHLPFFVVHELIGHKELRFFLPLASAAPALLTFCFYSEKSRAFFSLSSLPERLRSLMSWTGRFLILDNCLALLVMSFSPASRTILFFQGLDGEFKRRPDVKLIYTLGRDPYDLFGTPTFFYRPAGLEIRRIESGTAFESLLQSKHQPIYLVHHAFDLPPEFPALRSSCHPVYQSLPRWVEKFNFGVLGSSNGWLERITIWGLFECERS